jgi:predicted SnoaL-like aldol condensation-catalyzing enzyme
MTQATAVTFNVDELGVNADLALAFLEMAAAGRGQEALDRYGALAFRHHNPAFAGDGESLVAALADDWRINPRQHLEVVRIIAEGPQVVIHSRLTGRADGRNFATVHIFRVDDGKIQEMWDVTQENPASSPNQYGMF